MDRRAFLRSAAGASALVLVGGAKSFSAVADSHIDIIPDEQLGVISPLIYGHFTEQLGGVIYDGVWVGEGSKIPNYNGVRSAVVDRLKQAKASIIRWPGGCFADSYDWSDGIGARTDRPKRAGFWGNDEANMFGTPEFARFCRLSGAEPYIAANVRSLPPQAFDRWVEYCNAPANRSTLGQRRAADGFADPLNVKYWGVGNESWGCGGNMLPEEYSQEFRRFTAWVPTYGVPLQLIGSGPNGPDVEWTRKFFERTFVGKQAIATKAVAGWSLHYYTWNLSRGKSKDWDAAKGDALQFDAIDWYELLHEGAVLENIIQSHWAVMGEYDPDHHIKLVVDEYGPWYRPGTEVDPSHTLGQQITLRDAVHTAMTLDIFNRNPEKVGIATCAQLINCLNSLFLAHEDKFTTTPVFHVFDMYAAHQGATAVRTAFLAPQIRYQRDTQQATLAGLMGSASVNGKRLTLTVANPHVTEARETTISIRGLAPTSATATILTDRDIHAHNTFATPDAVRTTTRTIAAANTTTFTFPPASVTKIEFVLP